MGGMEGKIGRIEGMEGLIGGIRGPDGFEHDEHVCFSFLVLKFFGGSMLATEVKLNNRKLLEGMLDICGVPREKFRTICSSIDKLIFDQVRKVMVEEKGLTTKIADRIWSFVKDMGSPLEHLANLQQEDSEFLSHEGPAMALCELGSLFKAFERANGVDKIVFDLSLARGLDYYTGVIYEAVFKGTTQVMLCVRAVPGPAGAVTGLPDLCQGCRGCARALPGLSQSCQACR